MENINTINHCAKIGCKNKKHYGDGLCRKHHDETIENYSICSMNGCSNRAVTKNLCSKHYLRLRVHGDASIVLKKGKPINTTKCLVDECSKLFYAKNLCEKHYRKLLKYGDPNFETKEKGLGIISHGYRKIYKPKHPNSNSWGYIAEHRYVMSEKLGRPLSPNEYIHHKNGNRLDNKLENLELWVISQPSGQRVEDLITWAKEILEQYA